MKAKELKELEDLEKEEGTEEAGEEEEEALANDLLMVTREQLNQIFHERIAKLTLRMREARRKGDWTKTYKVEPEEHGMIVEYYGYGGAGIHILAEIFLRSTRTIKNEIDKHNAFIKEAGACLICQKVEDVFFEFPTELYLSHAGCAWDRNIIDERARV